MFLLFLFIMGLAVGSFLNVCIDRLPKNKSLMGRSKCDYCKKTLKAADLIPVLSFLILKRRCRYCHKKLSFYYPLVELITAITFVLIWFYVPEKNDLVRFANLGILTTFLGIFFADLKYQIIPDEFQVSLLFFGLLGMTGSGTTWQSIAYQLVYGAAVFSPMYFLYLVTNGKGMGFGDVKLSYAIGFLFGITGGLIALYLGFVLGAIAGLFFLISGMKKWKSKIAFGPFLVIGCIVVFLFEAELTAIVAQLFPF